MDNQENKDEGKSCCAKGGCCGGKALAVIGLLAVGGLGGYFCGRHCGQKDASPAAAAPANPAK